MAEINQPKEEKQPMTDKQYHDQQMNRAYNHLEQIEKAPLDERREARKEWTETLKLLDILTRNTEWLLGGNYGYGEMQLALKALEKKQKHVYIARLLAAFDDGCPARFAALAWKTLTPEEQQAANMAILAGIENHLRHEEEERQLQEGN